MDQKRIYNQQDLENENIEQQAENPFIIFSQYQENIEQFPNLDTVMKKINNKLISDLSKRHVKLAKNVIESQEDRAGDNHFLDYDEEMSDVDYYGHEEDDNQSLENQPENEDLKDIIKKAQEAGYLQQDNNFADNLEKEADTETSCSSTGSLEDVNCNQNKSTELRIDPNYKWLLKDLNLNNDKRVIDVTDVIEMNETKKEVNKTDEFEKVSAVSYEFMNKVNVSSSHEETSNEVSKAEELEEENDKGEREEGKKEDQEEDNAGNIESEHDETKNDHRFINQLYQKLVSKEESNNKPGDDKFGYTVDMNDADEDDEDDIGNRTTNDTRFEYKKWSHEFRSSNKIDKSISDKDDSPKENKQFNVKKSTGAAKVRPVRKSREFSKSFEISLEDMDFITDRVDSGIKLKRNKKHEQSSVEDEMTLKRNEPQISRTPSITKHKDSSTIVTPRTNAFIDDPANTKDNKVEVIESLKKEWSMMFSKLEVDYKNKLNEQQIQNENRLKELHDEIKQSIQMQQSQIQNNQNTIVSSEVQSQNSIVQHYDNTKFVANLRMELKNKHSRHVQDLTEYYEKELEELRKQISYYKNIEGQNNHATEINGGTKQENCDKKNELRSSNSELLNKLYKSGQHIRYLTEENCNLAERLKHRENELTLANEKISNLENCCNQLEQQLTETIKLQNQYIRELHVEKRNIVKKMQECEELKMSINFYEQKCDSFAIKLDEKSQTINRLKTQIVQLETDTNRLEYEYKKNTNQQKFSSNSNLNCEYIKSHQNGREIPIKHQLTGGLVVSTGSPTSSSSLSPSSPKIHMSVKSKLSPSSIRFGSASSMNQLNANKRLSMNTQNPNNSKTISNRTNEEESCQPRRQMENVDQQRIQRRMSMSPRRFIEREIMMNPKENSSNYNVSNGSNNKQPKSARCGEQSINGNYFNMVVETAEQKVKYIEHMEYEFDLLMKHKQQLNAQLTRLPYKATNATMHNLRESVENELESVEKKLSSVKLELRKLNIFKAH